MSDCLCLLRRCAFLFALVLSPGLAVADSAVEIDAKSDAALKQFVTEFAAGKPLLDAAKGVLVFPSVVKAGLLVGGEYGEGALRIGGKSVAYYSTAAASIGLQVGAQSKSIVILFLKDKALADFRASKGWEVGVNGAIAVIDKSAAGELDTRSITDPIIAFVFGNKGLMVDASLEGSKYTKLDM